MRERIAAFACLFLAPRAFFLGFLCAMVACSLAGRTLAQDGFYENFTRISGTYQVDNTFLLSPAQMVRWIRAHCSSDRELVLVGGSSIMMGAGQPVRRLWTKRLQELLGKGYCVVNLAGPSGALNGFASTTLGILGHEYKRAWLIGDMTEAVVTHSPDGVITQKSYFWSAYYNGMLEPSFLDHGRDESGKLRLTSPMSDKDRAWVEQLRLGEWLDSWLHFNELWSYLHYRYFTTYYFHNAGRWQWTPRATWPDYDFEFDEAQARAHKQYAEAVGSAGFNRTLERLRDLKTYFAATPSGLKLRENALGLLDTQLKDNIIDASKQNVVIAYIGVAPYYTSHLTADEQAAYETLYERKAAIFRRHGYHMVRPSLMVDDYTDLVHTNPLGGDKLAAAVAAGIRAAGAKR